jgi:GNAT superfamily N-acetyltransferase
VAALNSFIIVVNGYHLTRMLRAKRFFPLLKLRPESDYLKYFLSFYRRDITSVLPDFEYRPVANQVTLFVLRDCAPVGVFIAEQKPDGQLRVMLDFVIPGYRDLKLGRFLFVEQAEFFRERGIKEIVVAPRTKKFGAYLVKVGFEPACPRQESFRIRYADKPG